MDIVAALTVQLELEEARAVGLAGGLLLLVEDLVMERVDYGTAGRMRKAVPELARWQSSAPTIMPGHLSLSTVPAPKVSGDEGEFAGVLSRQGVDQSALPVALALTLEFLTSRLDAGLLATVLATVPTLKRGA